MLALVALLWTASLQLQEAGHGHVLDLHDSYAQCLLCKGSGPAAVTDSLANTAIPVHAPTANVPLLETPREAPGSPFLARGPPSYS
jgi:hypothetical protein